MARDAFWWIAPNGDRVLAYHLPRSGYELGANLPADEDAARARWSAAQSQLAPRATFDAVLLLNGADHHSRQTGLAEAIRALATVAKPDEARASSLREFAREIEQT